jgi:bacterioferritin
MDREKLVELLNGDLELEFRSIVQYTQHSATVKGVEFQPIADKIRPHLRQELEHATVLAEQIDFLGGEPTTRVPEVPNQTEPRRALSLDLELEERQLAAYRERFEQAEEMGLPDVAEALRPLLEQTQDHVRDLRGALGE